jgi:hypothetical protein
MNWKDVMPAITNCFREDFCVARHAWCWWEEN